MQQDKDARTARNARYTLTRLVALRHALVRSHLDVPNSFVLVLLGDTERASVIITCDTLDEQRRLLSQVQANIKHIVKKSLKHKEPLS